MAYQVRNSDLIDILRPDFASLFDNNYFNENNSILPGKYVKFGHANQTNEDDGKIGAGIFTSGLNIVGTQTIGGAGRRLSIYGDVYNGGSADKFWHAGNDGTGSGLNADVVDGYHANQLYGRGTTVYSNNVSQNIPFNTWTALTFTNYITQDSGGFDGSTAIYAQETGWHMAWAHCTMSAGATGVDHLMRFYINGTAVIGSEIWYGKAANGISLTLCSLIYVTANQYLQAKVFQLGGSPNSATSVSDTSRYSSMGLVRM